MKPKKHQRKAARKIISRLKQYGIVILAGEPRSGKTLSFIEACYKLKLKKILIVSTKKALKGIKESGIELSQSEKNFPPDDRIKGEHMKKNIKEISDKIKEKIIQDTK